MNVGVGPMKLPEGVTPIEAAQDFTARVHNSVDQAARAHADAVRKTVSDQQRSMLIRAMSTIKELRRRMR